LVQDTELVRKGRTSQALIKILLGLFSCGLVLSIGAQQASAAVSGVSFIGSSQVAGYPSTWTVGFALSDSLTKTGVITAKFPSGFVIPSTPTIVMISGFVSCTATGVTTGQSVAVSLAGNSCSLTATTEGKFSISGIVNPSSGTYAAAGFTVKTNKNSNTTEVANSATEVITAAPSPTISALNVVKGSSGGGTVVVLTGTNMLWPSSVTFGGVSGVVGVVTETSISVTTGARRQILQQVLVFRQQP